MEPAVILWVDGAHGARENMRRDLLLLEVASRRRPEWEAVLRLFRFSPPGITLGRSQDPARELDLDRCRAEGVDWAVRPTGGRAIFHAEEWTYSITAASDDPAWGGGLSVAYERGSRLVLESLRRLGVPAVLARRSGIDAAALSGTAASPACFARAARHEILLDGRKLVGSAQRRTAHALLQQGSVLTGPGHLRLADYLARSGSHDDVRASLSAAATDASAFLGPDPGLERWADALASELPPETRRIEGPAGLFLLTLSEDAPYTLARARTGPDHLHGG